MPNGCIAARDRNQANLLMKELQRIEDAINLLRTLPGRDESIKALAKYRTEIRHRLDKLSC
jgi:geranylgeranyl pyrophosphate synthase